jgi:hypothetical protein
LRELKAKFLNQGQISKDEVSKMLIESDYEEVLSGLKEDYRQMAQGINKM